MIACACCKCDKCFGVCIEIYRVIKIYIFIYIVYTPSIYYVNTRCIHYIDKYINIYHLQI